MTGTSQESKSSTTEAFFPIYENSKTLDEAATKKLVHYAQHRVEKGNLLEYTKKFTSTRPQISILTHSQIELGALLGQGSFSSAYEIKKIREDNGTTLEADKVVVKVLRPKLASKLAMFATCIADITNEAMILRVLNHENIISLQGTAPDPILAYSNGRHDAYFLILEKIVMTLSKRLKRWRKEFKKITFGLSQKKKLKKTRIFEEQVDAVLQVAAGVKYLHSMNILHRDIKPANIGFDPSGVVKIFDFDVARVVPDSSNVNEAFQLTKRTGSARYMAPEVAKGCMYNLKADVYSFGILCHEIISLKKPYSQVPTGKHDQYVVYGQQRPEIPLSWPQAFRTFLNRSWDSDIWFRPTIDEAERILHKELTQMLLQKKIISKGPWTLMKSVKTGPTTICVNV